VADFTDYVLADWKGEVGSRRRGVASAAPICAGGAESADMSLSDRERAEGFHLTAMSTVETIATVVVEALSTPIAQLTEQRLRSHLGRNHSRRECDETLSQVTVDGSESRPSPSETGGESQTPNTCAEPCR